MSGVTYAIIQGIRKDVDAALLNEQLTRQRVENCEDALKTFRPVALIAARGFWGRFKWLLAGR